MGCCHRGRVERSRGEQPQFSGGSRINAGISSPLSSRSKKSPPQAEAVVGKRRCGLLASHLTESFARDDPSRPAPSAHLRSCCQPETEISKRWIFYPPLSRIVSLRSLATGNKLHTSRCTQRIPASRWFLGTAALSNVFSEEIVPSFSGSQPLRMSPPTAAIPVIQIAWMLVDPFDLIHQIQRFIGSALNSSAASPVHARLR